MSNIAPSAVRSAVRPSAALRAPLSASPVSALERVYQSIPAELRERGQQLLWGDAYRSVLLLPQAMRRTELKIAPRLIEMWLFGLPTRTFQRKELTVRYLPLPFRQFNQSRAFQKLLQDAGLKLKEVLQAIAQDGLGTKGEPAKFLQEVQARGRRQLRRLKAGQSISIEEFGDFVSNPFSYVGQASIRVYEAIVRDAPDNLLDLETLFLLLDALARRELPLPWVRLAARVLRPSDFAASLGSCSIRIYLGGELKKVDHQTAEFRITKYGYRTEDSFDFNPPDEGQREQPLGWWSPERGFAPVEAPYLDNRTFREFREDIQRPFNVRAEGTKDRVPQLVCRDFWVLTNTEVHRLPDDQQVLLPISLA